MHEFSLATTLLDTIWEIAKQNNITRIKKVVVKFGIFALVMEDQFKFSFDMIKEEEEITKDAELEIIWENGLIKCNNCGYEGETKPLPGSEYGLALLLKCPNCNSSDISIIKGTETYIDRIEF